MRASNWVRSYYKEERAGGWNASRALAHARARDAIETAEAEGFARLRIVADECPDADNLCGDCSESERKRTLERADRDGVFGIVAEYRVTSGGPWVESYSCWGFIGDDWKGSGYDSDARGETVRTLATCGLVF